ncbi:hypothetical protein DRQ23_01905 [bacterium]|nr:MAG: hypothetical protein DRQ23_01905 [bacterium]
MKKEQINLIIGYTVLILLIVLYQWYIMKKRANLPPEQAKGTVQVEKEIKQPVKTKTAEIPVSTIEKTDTTGAELEEFTFETQLLKVTFQNIGAEIKEVYLKPYNVYLRPKKGPLFSSSLVVKGERILLSRIPFKKEISGNSVIFTAKVDTLEIKRVYTFTDSGYTIQVENFPRSEYYLSVFIFDTDEKIPDKARYAGGVYSLAGKVYTVKTKSMEKTDRRVIPGVVDWAGYKTKYFLASVIPPDYAGEVSVEKVEGYPAVSVRTDKPIKLFIGPLEYKTLAGVKKGLENAIYFGWSLIRPIAKLIYFVLTYIHRFINNYGVVIIIFTIIMAIVLSPLSILSFRSMKGMKEIQPKIQEIQKKYKKDPQRMNAEIMELYRKHGVNPFSGCLPLFIQMPVFFALFAVLNSTIELKGAPFIFWIKDLSLKDPYFVLPILMGITMFLQQRFFSPQQPGAEQKSMTFIMPIVLTFIFSSLPSGLVLYWFVYNLLSIIQQIIIKKQAEGG